VAEWPTPADEPGLHPVRPGDFEDLLALRIRAMRPSLETIGRFHPERARERLASTFVPQHMHHLVRGGQRVGAVTLRPTPEALVVDHLYIEPAHQRTGVGAWVMDWACASADLRRLPPELEALRGSDSNCFYLRHGMVEVGADDLHVAYRREPCTSPLVVLGGLWRAIQARDWPAVRALLHEDAVVHWLASGEQMSADAYVAVNAAYPEGWSVEPLQLQALHDARVLSLVRVPHGAEVHLAHSLARVRHGRIVHLQELWATCHEPPAWRTPARFAGLRRVPAEAAPP
jgi:GNAT superfamily N-acetyltransferase